MTQRSITKWARRVLIGVTAAYLLYLAGANVMLSTGMLETVISRRPVKFQIGWERAWTLLPGRVHVDKFSMQGQARTSQWRFDLDEASVDVHLTALFLKRFHATRVQGAGARFKIRRQRIGGEPIWKGAHLEPVIPGMPQVRPPLEQLQPRPKRRFPWRIHLDGIEVEQVAELWLSTHRIAGNGMVEGDLRIAVGGELEIPRAGLKIPVAQVFTGDDHVGRDLEVRLGGAIVPTMTRGRSFLELLPSITARLDLAGAVADFGFLNLYFRRLPNLRLQGGGNVDCTLDIDRGAVTSESAMSFDSNGIVVGLRDFEMTGRGVIEIAVSEGKQAVFQAEISHVGFAEGGRSVLPPGRRSTDRSTDEGTPLQDRPEHEPIVGGEPCRLSLNALSSLANLADPFSDLAVLLDLPDCFLSDLTGLNQFIPDNLPVTFLPDTEAAVGAHLELSESAGDGELRLRGKQIAAVLHQLPVVGDVILDLRIRGYDPEEFSFDLSGSRFEIQDLAFNRSDSLSGDGWWAWINFNEARLEFAAPISLSARVGLGLRDTMPLVAAFSPREKVSLLAGLLDPQDFEAKARMQLGRSALQIEDLGVQASGFGRILLGGEGAVVSLASARLDPMRGFEGLAMELDLAGVEVPDLAVFNRYIPEGSGVRLDSGSSGTVSGRLEIDDGWFKGFAEVTAHGVGLEICNLSMNADLGISLQLPGVNIEDRFLDLSGSQLWFDRVSLPGEPRPPGDEWGALIRLEEGFAELSEPVSVNASVTVWMRDTRPLIAAYLPAERAGMRLEDLLNIEDVSVHARLFANREALRFDDLEISGRGSAAGHLRGRGFEVTASSLKLDTDGGFTDLDLAVELPRSELVDLAAFNSYIPEKAGLGFGPGSGGMVSAWMRVADGLVTGEAELSARSIELDLGGTTTVGDLNLKVKLNRGDLETQHYDIGGTSVTIDEVYWPESEVAAADPWWARVGISHGELELSKPFALETRIDVEMDDSRPLVELVSRKGGKRWLAEILNFNDLVGSVKLRLSEEAVTLDELEIRGLGSTGNGILGPGLHITASGSDVDFDHVLEGLELTLDLPESEVRDLSMFNRYISDTATVFLLPEGQGAVQAHLDLASGRGVGDFQLRGSGFGVQIGETVVRGDLDLDVRVSSGDLEDLVFEIAGSRLQIDEMSVLGSDGSERSGWSASVLLTEGTVTMGYPLGVGVDVALSLSDTWPLVSYAAEKSWLARLFKRPLTVDNVRGRSRIEFGSSGLVFDDLVLGGEGFEAEGRLKLFEGGSDGILFFGLRGLSTAVKLDGKDRKWKLFGPRKWYERLLPAVDFGGEDGVVHQ
ncbi:MAG: hypothetical protein ABFS37_02365 [Acidobacteriota bacterium]